MNLLLDQGFSLVKALRVQPESINDLPSHDPDDGEAVGVKCDT